MRNQEQIKLDREAIKRLIINNFSDKEFSTGDIYYSFYDYWNKSKFGAFFTDMKELSKIGFVNYRIGLRHTGKSKQSKYLREGAIYTLNKN